MYELLILGHLYAAPAHGYLIAKIINDMIGPYARFSNGRLYPLLTKLEQNELIAIDASVQAEQSNRPFRAYCITESGRKRFRSLMMDISSNPGEYQRIFLQKASFFSYITQAERLYLIEHFLNYCQTHILHLQNEMEDMTQNHHSYGAKWTPVYQRDVFETVEHVITQWQLEYSWAQHLKDRELADTDAMEKGAEN
ncbi:PadR family transcriptional regulator [Ktedonospora formicarum]|uniref:Transcription regulator PadR N-terminal domain-containing protein n=1 Tax=Ktedonospora formicarum TaxID=2778364 RepID=A0A8J3HY76_9CHLR|nr:PadR family transcriptional regulator [Ktedonospora formicarum]GHO42817.1 hypothetical protein KSX_09800 [Ktedonospora formicarum]